MTQVWYVMAPNTGFDLRGGHVTNTANPYCTIRLKYGDWETLGSKVLEPGMLVVAGAHLITTWSTSA